MKSELIPDYLSDFLDSYNSIDIESMYAYSLTNKVPSVEKSVGETLRFLAKLSKAENILELGCGIGVATKYLYYDNKVNITAVDCNHDRINTAKDHFGAYDKVDFVCNRAEKFLLETENKYDFVFVDTVKREYPGIWYLLQQKLESRALVVFDDILLYGYCLFEDSEIPYKYLGAVRELRNFIDEILTEHSSNANVLPAGNGMLLINYEKC